MADNIKEMVDKYIEDGVMTREEHDEFIKLVHADGVIDDEESEQISRIFKLISDGKLVIVDEMREKFEKKRQEDAAKLADSDEDE
ncbi:MAG: hypothetical protein KDD66_11795 [Bdellovibrionales bacterium]|nr:hypothetical protein [Bdellovibrionales bacterium]